MYFRLVFLWAILTFTLACTSNTKSPKSESKAKKEAAVVTTTPDIAEAKALIAEQATNFSKYFVDGNFEAMLDIYTEDAKIFPAKQKILSGQDLRNYWLPKPDAKHKVIHHKVTAEELKILGNEAYDYGYYEGKTQMDDGSVSEWGGKYVIIWKEVEAGVWKMYLDIWN